MTHPAGTAANSFPPLGFWVPDAAGPADDPAAFRTALGTLREPVVVVETNAGFALARGGSVTLGGPVGSRAGIKVYPVVAMLPPLSPDRLGDPTFLADQSLKYPYMTGAMANGIGSAE